MAEKEAQHKLHCADPDTIVDLPVGQLLLDPDNARLGWRADGASQEDLVGVLWTEMAVDEVAWSIAENGFFRSEPLFVIIQNPQQREAKRQRFTVVEGNRRLASVLLLRDEDLRTRVGATDLPTIDATRRSELAVLPAIVYPDR